MPPYIVFSALFHCSLYRGHIIARAAICFGNLELYFLAEQQQKYLLLTQTIHTKCGRLLLRTILNHAIHDGIIWQKSPKCAIICRLLVCEIVSLIGSGHQNFTWFALRYSVGDVPSMLLNVLQSSWTKKSRECWQSEMAQGRFRPITAFPPGCGSQWYSW